MLSENLNISVKFVLYMLKGFVPYIQDLFDMQCVVVQRKISLQYFGDDDTPD